MIGETDVTGTLTPKPKPTAVLNREMVSIPKTNAAHAVAALKLLFARTEMVSTRTVMVATGTKSFLILVVATTLSSSPHMMSAASVVASKRRRIL